MRCMNEVAGAAMSEVYDPVTEAALDRALAAMASPSIPRALMARMVAEIPRLPQFSADEGGLAAMTSQGRGAGRRRFVPAAAL